MKKVLVASLMIPFCISTSVFAKDTDVKTYNLKPVKGSDIILDDITYSINNNEIHVAVEGKAHSKGIQSYKIEIDPNTKTYKTTELTREEIEKEVLDEEELKELKELSTEPLRISPYERKDYYTGWMKITTEDPVRVAVCATKLTLKWEEDIDGLIEETSHNLKPWAANPTKFDTHWYIDSSGDTPPKANKDNSKITYKGYADYYNDDFGLKDWRTHVNHELKMVALPFSDGDGGFDYSWDYDASGDSSALLSFTLTTSMD
ncbi:hypothetical protein EEL31_21645 [Brevibacillus laterosporus]|nr:hypothetical protein [Brevibacillus laterosporus]TPG70791.1 hypothetical protein EEL31_21645 [Brevibacillus laterosporus]